MAKDRRQNTTRKELSEGKAIILAVLGITISLIGAIYVLWLILGFFFPGLMN